MAIGGGQGGIHGLIKAGVLLWVACSLLACTAASVPVGQPDVKPALFKQPVLRTSDGSELVLANWQPAGKAVANLILLHGFNEYSGAFAEVGEQFARQGVAVWAYDQRGFGHSAYRGLWSSAERMAQDAREMAALLRSAEPDTPLYLLGMSMGGAVALLAAGEENKADTQVDAQANSLDVDGMILVAPAVWISATQPFYQRWGLEVAKKFTPGWSPTGEGLKIRASDNDAMLRRIWKSPWMIRGSRMDTVAGLVDLMDKGYAAAPGVKVPTLLLYGKKDQLVPEKPINMLWETLPKQAGTRQIRYKNGWHMLMRDLQGDKVIGDIAGWMRQR